MSTGRAEGFGMTRRTEGERLDDAGAQLVESLSELGLTPNQSRAYVALLEHGAATATEIALRARVPRPKIYDVLQSLERFGLCASGGGDRVARWEAVAPEAAIPDWIRRREQERRGQAERDQALATELVRSLPRPAEEVLAGDAPLIEAVIGRKRIAEAYEAVVTAA